MDTTNTVIMLLSAASGKLSNVPTEHSTSFISSEREEKTMALTLWQQRLFLHERKKDHTTYDGNCSATPRASLFTSDTAVANQVLPPPAPGGLDCCDGFPDCGPPDLEHVAPTERVLLRGERFLRGWGVRHRSILRRGRGEIGRRGEQRSALGRSVEQASQRKETALI